MNKIEPNDTVTVLRDITRVEGLYAVAGTTGVVLELFQPHGTKKSPWSAKVRMADGTVKTFRVTSLGRN